MTTPFWKIAGGANDYILLDGRSQALPEPLEAAWVSGLCARRYGIGSDGVLVVREARGGADYRLEFYNPDGSVHGLCGNGTRATARVAHLEGWAGAVQSIEVAGGTLRAEVAGDRVRLHVGAPRVRQECRERRAEDRSWPGELMEIHVPHLIVEVGEEELPELDVDARGRALRYHSDFEPGGTNVIFTAVASEDTLRLRSYERGVEAETLACGSGATAAAASMVRRGKVRPPVLCHTASGTVLTISFEEGRPGHDAHAILEGDARLVAHGALGPDAATGRRRDR